MSHNPTILFIGAGFSFSSGVRTAWALKEKVLEELNIQDNKLQQSLKNVNSIQELADILDSPNVDNQYDSFQKSVAKNLYSFSPIISPEYKMLTLLIKRGDIRTVYTTNQDTCLENALQSQGVMYNRFVYPHDKKMRNNSFNANRAVDIFKLCGDLHDPYEMCFSTEELRNATNSKFFKKLTKCFEQNCTILFIGYSVSDDPIGKKLCEISQKRKRNSDHAKILCVDVKQSDGHISLLNPRDFGDQFISKTAEEYLQKKIIDTQPNITVKHALFDEGKFGGVQTYAYSLIELCKMWEPHIFASTYSTRSFLNDRNLGGFQYMKASCIAETTKAICSDRPDIIHAHSFISAHTSNTLGIPCILTSHSKESSEATYSDSTDPLIGDILSCEEKYYPQSSTILTLSEFHKEELPSSVQHYTSVKPAPFLSPNILGIETNIKSQEKRLNLNQEYGETGWVKNWKGENRSLADDKKTISFFGRPDIRKGLPIFCNAIKKLFQKTEIDFQVLFVGPTITKTQDGIKFRLERSYQEGEKFFEIELDENLRECMYCVQENTASPADKTFIEHQKRMYDYYFASDIVVMPSQYETFGYVALEAMACGRPIIACNIPGLYEVFGKEGEMKRGILVDIKASEDETAATFAHEIQSVLNEVTHPPVAEAKQWVENTYNKDSMKKLVQEMYITYLNRITSSRNVAEDEMKLFDAVLRKNTESHTEWDELLYRSAESYEQLRKILNVSTKEDLTLIWNIAYWLKMNKPVYPEISIMPVAELAELLTAVVRCSKTEA